MSLDNQESVVRVRGKDFPLSTLRPEDPEPKVVAKTIQVLILGLYAIQDPRVDEILRKFKVVFVWPDQKKQTRLFDDQDGG